MTTGTSKKILHSSTNSVSVHLPSDEAPSKKTFIIGVSGGTASGKTSVCDMIVKALNTKRVAIISQDSFYKCLNEEEKQHAKLSNYNFDHPAAFDWPLIEQTMKEIGAGRTVKIPEYDFVTHSRVPDKGMEIEAIDVILFEGILSFYQPEIVRLMDMKIFVDTDADTRLARRILRDLKERGRDLEGILSQYQRFVKPSFEEYIMPTKKYADVIIPRGADNNVAINLIVQHIKHKLEEKHLPSLHRTESNPSIGTPLHYTTHDDAD